MQIVASRMEINVLDHNAPYPRISEFVVKNYCPAIVTVPQLVPAFVVDRESKRSSYKIIAALDFPSGTNFGMQKIRDMGPDAGAADGFDIVCTPNRQSNESFNEIKSVTEFLRTLNPLAEIRWVLGAFGRPYKDVQNCLNCFNKVSVNWVRLDQRLEDKTIDLSRHVGTVESIRRSTTFPLKLSGNITKEVTDKFMNDKAVRFDVTFEQALSIMAEYQNPVKKNEEPPKNEKPAAPGTIQSEIEGQQIIGIIGQDVK